MVREWEWEWISSHLFVYGNLRSCCFRRRRGCCRSIHCHRWVARLVIFEKILCITTTLVIVIHSFIIKFVVCRRLLPFAPIESSRILCVSFRHYHRQQMIFYFLFLFSVIFERFCQFIYAFLHLSVPFVLVCVAIVTIFIILYANEYAPLIFCRTQKSKL